ncbi:MAG: hypothetical protein Q7R94_03185, partial [bacterium]|nr:hypothetical protein [bacterium]
KEPTELRKTLIRGSAVIAFAFLLRGVNVITHAPYSGNFWNTLLYWGVLSVLAGLSIAMQGDATAYFAPKFHDHIRRIIGISLVFLGIIIIIFF